MQMKHSIYCQTVYSYYAIIRVMLSVSLHTAKYEELINVPQTWLNCYAIIHIILCEEYMISRKGSLLLSR